MGTFDIPPVSARAGVNAGMPFQDRIAIEGRPYYTSINFSGTLSASLQLGQFTAPSYGRAFWIENLEVSSNRAIDIQITLPDLKYGNIARQHRFYLLAGESKIIPARTLVRPGDYLPASLAFGTITCRTVLDATATGALVQVNAVGAQIYDDLNFAADKVMLWVGDSITNDGTGIADRNQGYHALTRNYFRSIGSNVRLVNGSISSSTSSDHERFRSFGQYDLPKVDIIFYSLGTNDVTAPTVSTRSVTTTSSSTSITGLFTAADVGAAITGTGIPVSTTIVSQSGTAAVLSNAATASATVTATSTAASPNAYQANLASFITWKQQQYPQAKLIVLGSPPLNNSTNETALAAIRSAASTLVTNAADSTIKYCSLASAFDRTITGNYAGDGVHPLAQVGAHQALYSTLQSFLATNSIVP